MKRVGRLILDIIGGAAALLSLIFAIISLTGKLSNFHDLPDAAKKAIDLAEGLNGNVAYWFAIVGAAIGALGIIGFVIALFLIFKSGSHLGLTVSIFVFAVIGLGLTSYSLYANNKLGDIPLDVTSIFKNVLYAFKLNTGFLR